jgi:hypothetical protein
MGKRAEFIHAGFASADVEVNQLLHRKRPTSHAHTTTADPWTILISIFLFKIMNEPRKRMIAKRLLYGRILSPINHLPKHYCETCI